MNRPEIIENLKNIADKLGISESIICDILVHNSEWYLNLNEDKFILFNAWLKNINFKFLLQEDGEDICKSVIELNDQAYQIEYYYYSHGGYEINDVWNWKPVTAKVKTIVYYE